MISLIVTFGHRAIEPLDRGLAALRHTDAELIGTTGQEYAVRIALIGTAPRPANRLDPIIGDAFAVLVRDGQIVLGDRISLRRGLAVPLRGARGIRGQTLPACVLLADLQLRRRVAPLTQPRVKARSRVVPMPCSSRHPSTAWAGA